MPKSIKKLMHLGIYFWKDLEGYWKPKWSHVGTQIDQKSMPLAKSDFLKNRALPTAGAWFFRFGGSKLGTKIDQKSIKKGVQHGKASWHRFLIDFDGFWEASWGRKSNKTRSKKLYRKWMFWSQDRSKNKLTQHFEALMLSLLHFGSSLCLAGQNLHRQFTWNSRSRC